MSASSLGRINVGSTCAMTMAAFAIFMLSAGSAQAQFWFGPRHSFWPGQFAPFKHRHHHRQANSQSTANARPEAASKGPLQIIVSIADQRVSLFDNGTLIARSSVSTGVQGHPTPLGVFSVIEKRRWHRSNIYSAAPMPYMQRITWSGIALHAGVVPGHPASHGCIRLKKDFAARLWHLTKRGARVIIARDEVQPVETASPRLFKPKAVPAPPEIAASAVAGNSTAAATQGSPPSNGETPETTGLQAPAHSRLARQPRPKRSFRSPSS